MPGPKCVVLDCYKVKFPKNARIAYHKFPRDTDLRHIWFQKIGVEGQNLETGFVCSKHFKTDDYMRDLQAELLGYSGRRKLKPSAVPSVNLPFEEEEISPEEKERLEKEQHQKLIQDCLNGTEQKTVLSFELFKKLRYSNSRSRRGRKPKNPSRHDGVVVFNVKPQPLIHESEDDSQVVVVTLPSGEEHIVRIKNLEDSPAEYSQDDSNICLDISEDTEMPSETDNTALHPDDPAYWRQRIRQLEEQVSHQKKIICSLRRQIIREKKMMEKVILATNCGQTLPPIYKKKFQYDEKSKAALLKIYSLAPTLYPRFSKLLNLPPKSVLSTWDPEISSLFNQDSSQKVLEETADEEFQESNFVEEEYIIQSDDFVQL